jgi:hypothetical protein
MDWKQVTDRANEIIDQRGGGTQSLKRDAEELKDIVQGEGNVGDQANAPWTRSANRAPLTTGPPRVKRPPLGRRPVAMWGW